MRRRCAGSSDATSSGCGRYVEHYGGTVEKFIGDAVMAVFGIPAAHEDDAVRAMRAALDMRDAFPALEIAGRIGVASGEVVTGTSERLVTGDAVNLAARLEQAAQPGEVLIDNATRTLAAGTADVEPLPPLTLKGKGQPVQAYRLRSVCDARPRSQASRFVGRAAELADLRSAWERALRDELCELVTVVGEPGIGKSRLVGEVVASLGATRVVQGRCLPYGEGITYWPVVEVIRQLNALPSDPSAAAAIGSLVGDVTQPSSAEEIAWAFRRLLEEQAPLICVFEDIHWGEETFLDLVEQVGLLSAGSSILLLCLARPELLARRPAWTITLRLSPLADDEVAALVGEEAPVGLRERIAHAAGGNPLFVTEMLAIAEQSTGDIPVPPTLRALLAARLDLLDPAERRVVECGSVEGEIFHRAALQTMDAVDADLTPRLTSLVRKELIRPDRAQLPREDAFRFRHLLLRDSAYEGLAKSARADLHARFAAWLEERHPDLVELDEIVGYHLAQAARYSAELGRSNPEVAERAAERLAKAGRRALLRGDYTAAASLLERALALTAAPHAVDIELDLASIYRWTAPQQAIPTAERAAKRARSEGDEVGAQLAEVMAAWCAVQIGEQPLSLLETRARAALQLLNQGEDHARLMRAWSAVAFAAVARCRFADGAAASEQAVRHAGLAGTSAAAPAELDLCLVMGPVPADEALHSIDTILTEVPKPFVLLARAWLLAMLGRFDEAWRLGTEAARRQEEQGGGSAGDQLGAIALLAGDLPAAITYFRAYCDWCEAQGMRGVLSTYAPVLGRALCAAGRYDEAEPLAKLGRELGQEEDRWTQLAWRQAEALVGSHKGNHRRAQDLARQAVDISQQTDSPLLQGDALCDLAEVLSAAGRRDEATAALKQALDRYRDKRNLAMIAQVRARLAV